MAANQAAANQAAEYVDEDGLRERYQISPRTAQRWRSSGDGPPYVRLGKRRVVYRVADVERWLAARTFASIADELAHVSVAKNAADRRCRRAGDDSDLSAGRATAEGRASGRARDRRNGARSPPDARTTASRLTATEPPR
jgi:hypothetical protein